MDKGGRNAHPFLRLSKKNFYSVKISPHLFGITKPNDTLFRRKMRKYFSVAGALFCLLRKTPSFIPTGNSQMHPQNLKKFFVPSLIWNWDAKTQPVFQEKQKKFFEKTVCLKNIPSLVPTGRGRLGTVILKKGKKYARREWRAEI